MSWNKIIGNERIKRILQLQLIEGRIANSYLFIGINGIGKEAIAIEFAKAMNCEKPIISRENYNACDNCKSCKQISNFTHQNLEIIFPLPTSSGDETATDKLSEAQIEEIKSQFERKSIDPYKKIKLKGANSIRVNSIRDVKKKLSLSQGLEGKRVVVVSEADKMNIEASNAFLKTLEEPNNNIIIILCTSQIDKILPTIKSRCQIINFVPIDKNEIEQKILLEHNISKETAKLAAELSMGSLTKALEYFDHNFIEMRKIIVNALRNSLKKKNYRKDLSEIISEILKNYDKEEIIFLLQILSIWIRDAELIKSNYHNISNPDDKETLEKFATNFHQKNLIYINEFIEHSIYLINRNVILNGVIYQLFIKIRYYLLDK